MDNKDTYIHILISTLNKKNNLLDKLYQITLLQEEYLSISVPNLDGFEETIEDKEVLIGQLDQLDDGFEKVYDYVKSELSINKNMYKDQVIELQALVKQVTEKSARLQVLEMKNKNKLELYLVTKKKEIKNFKISSRTATNYYKNMANEYQGDSYFLDKKK